MGTADASRRFAYCSRVVGTLPSRRLADDVPLLATPRHPTRSKLTACNWFVYFKLTNFGGHSGNVGILPPSLSALSVCPHSTATPTAHPGALVRAMKSAYDG